MTVAERRPYRVVFAGDPPTHGGGRRHGTVVARDAEAAHREARGIATGGRRAEVHYLTEEGERRVVAVYPAGGSLTAVGPSHSGGQTELPGVNE